MGKPTGSRRKAAKAPGTKRKKPCAHRHANFDTIWNGQRVEVMGCYAIWYGDDPQFGYGKYRKIFGARCLGCGVQLPLGPANDEDNSYVHEEMAAAEFARQRGIVDVAVQLGFLDHAGEADPPELAGPGWRAGWLAREIATHGELARDIDAWAWDPKRPIAKQDEPWMRPNEHDLRNACVSAGLVASTADAPVSVTVSVTVDSDAVQINGLCDVAPMFDPDEAEELADDLLLGACAARQAQQDDYHGPAVVVELRVGEEPSGWTATDHEAQRAAEPDPRDEDDEAPPIGFSFGLGLRVCAHNGVTPNDKVVANRCRDSIIAQNAGESGDGPPDLLAACDTCDVPFGCRDGRCERGREGERKLFAPRRESIAELLASVAEPDDDPPTDPSTKFGAQAYAYVGPVAIRQPPTAENCRLLGAARCSHDEMTAEETQSVFGKELQDG